ncbi:hypothetical protein [Lignipirellula cremea]|uniref:Lipoprotein n=1 Tax=Lignipirellula cremea TaxID=2528010 RepID=A0A518DSF4_9BACT|nr:hypothetical protein [Lignipirellula cremea]QDU94776.1 hypothetical protein Pla8534_25830 [Lignipirellula cremea]
MEFAVTRLTPLRGMALVTLTLAALTAVSVGCGKKDVPQASAQKVAPAPLVPIDFSPPPVSERPEVETELIKAEVGVGEKGRRLNDPDVVQAIAAPAKALFSSKERLVFDVQIPHALNLYRATNDDKVPATHEAFMEEIVKFNQIPLPELPPGHTYLWDPDKQELMVKRPVAAPK